MTAVDRCEPDTVAAARGLPAAVAHRTNRLQSPILPPDVSDEDVVGH
jgi:hypothetical protein